METSARGPEAHPGRPATPCGEEGEFPDYAAEGVPTAVAAALKALRFCDRSTDQLRNIPAAEWPDFVAWAESRQLALTIEGVCGDRLPATERALLARRSESFLERMLRLREALREISSALGTEQIAFVVLKGFTHSPDLTPNPLWRAQGDIDIWCLGKDAATAFEVLRNLGYVAMPSHSRRHLPPLVRPQNWKWNGNLASVPISVEIHQHLWEEETEYAGTPDETQIWSRTATRTFFGDTYQVLRTEDLISFASFHLFLHLANGDLPLQRAWEIGNFLHNRADDEPYWSIWQSSCSTAPWAIELFVFRLIERWFSCRLPGCVIEASETLPEDVRFWLSEFSFEPLKAQNNSNKNYLWLNCSLLLRWRDRITAVRRCFFPVGLPIFVDRLDDDLAPEPIVYRLARQRHHLFSRAKHHWKALYPTLKGGLVWAGHKYGLDRAIFPFLFACALFDIGEFLFVILFTFYLLELGFREDAIGLAAASMSAGTLAGTPLATFVAHRFGLNNALVIGALGCCLATLLRIAFTGGAGLFVFALLNGVCFSFWAVAFVPTIAALSRPKNRSFAYGLATSLGISIGIIAGPVATRLPAVLHTQFALSSFDAKRAVLCTGSLLLALAALPVLRLRVQAQRSETAVGGIARGRFVTLFAGGVFLWILATGSFNAFFTPFFSLQIGLSMVQIGTLFAIGQSVQVVSTLAAPLLGRRIGEARYVATTVIATAAMLLLLAGTSGKIATGCLYLGYVAFQYANEPSLFAWLMNRVSAKERAQASGLLFITMSVAGLIAAAVSGRLIAKTGYSPVLVAAACLATIAAVFFAWASRQTPVND
jgi:MFS family permease